MPSLYIVLEKKLPNTDVDVDGHMLSKYNDRLEAMAAGAGVAPLMSFFSAGKDALIAFAEEHGVTLDETKVPEERWFKAEEGLQTVNALLENVSSLQVERIEAELTEFRRLLTLAKASGIRWHLGVDY